MIDDAFGHWLAGYIDGEGHFCGRYYPGRHGVAKYFCIVARADEYPLLEECQRRTGLGRLYSLPAHAGSKPCWCWKIASTLESLRLVNILEKYPLRSKKRRDFKIWAEINREMEHWKRGAGAYQNDRSTVERLAKELVDVRVYDDQYERVT